MPLSNLGSLYHLSTGQRFEQGDILRDVEFVTWVDETDGELATATQVLPYCAILTQDCDLEQDYNARSTTGANHDKHLPSILLCPAYTASSVKDGTHLSGQGLTMGRQSSDNWNKIKQNNFPRYHYLGKDEALQLPELVLDFKHYFTIPRDTLYLERFQKTYRATIEVLFREHVSHRFAHYLSRIGLPDTPSE
jgi:hypothetical protein